MILSQFDVDNYSLLLRFPSQTHILVHTKLNIDQGKQI